MKLIFEQTTEDLIDLSKNNFRNNRFLKILFVAFVGLILFVLASSFLGLPDDRGIIPDHIVKPVLSDILNNIDTDMNYAFDLIKNEHGE